MNTTIAFLYTLWKNPHTRWCVISLVVLLAVCHLGPIWVPSSASQFADTEKWFSHVLAAWAIYANVKGLASSPSTSQNQQQQPVTPAETSQKNE